MAGEDTRQGVAKGCAEGTEHLINKKRLSHSFETALLFLSLYCRLPIFFNLF